MKSRRVSSALPASFGARYFSVGARAVVDSPPEDLYAYRLFVGRHDLTVERGDSVVWLSDDATTARWSRGAAEIASRRIATVLRGYAPEERSSGLAVRTTLPYVNACSSKQVFPPERPGDPTLQLLDMPPHSSEQAHHIHSTTRVVYILRGHGKSVVGMEGGSHAEPLEPGMVVLLHPMCPHHFETDRERLVCLPLHVFSSVPTEVDHPMALGTHRV